MKTKSSIAIIPLLGFLLACSSHKKEVPKTQDNNVISIKTTRVQKTSESMPVVVSGLVASATEARLSFKTGGIIDRIYVEEGDYVQKGQLLATLKLTEIKAQVNQAEEAFQKAERDLKRVQNLYKDSVASLEQLQNATTGYNVSLQNAEIARFNLSYSEIRATTAGKVVRKLMNEGELTSPGNPVFFINATGPNDWEIKVGVADKDWARLKIGDKGTATLDAFPNEIFPVKVNNLAQGADPMTGLYQLELKINAKGKNLATGLFASVNLEPSQSSSYLSIPIEAIVEGNGNQAFVFVPENNKAKKLPIKVAFIKDDQVLISEGLTEGQEIISAGSAYLGDGVSVQVNP